MSERKINFLDWFDYRNINHIEAFLYYNEHKKWPSCFIPIDIFFPDDWYISLLVRMACAWALFCKTNEKGEYYVNQQCDADEENRGCLETVFLNGKITKYQTLGQIRKRVEGRYRDWETDRKSTRLNSSHSAKSRMPSSA